MSSVLWFQAGTCSRENTMSFLNAEEPNVVDLIVDFGLELLWHPSLGMELATTPPGYSPTAPPAHGRWTSSYSKAP